nr:immunoglobulin heavy chain junction region [Mus musculus]MBK4185301.1 immunoglobulin heavy chain junction region [Mus musculus]
CARSPYGNYGAMDYW